VTTEKRQFKRYRVSRSEILAGFVVSCKAPHELQSLGVGGCGFLGGDLEDELQLNQKVSCVFSLPDSTWQVVEGRILYARPLDQGPSPKIFYGIEFSENDRKRIEPAIENLEHLAADGQIQRV